MRRLLTCCLLPVVAALLTLGVVLLLALPALLETLGGLDRHPIIRIQPGESYDFDHHPLYLDKITYDSGEYFADLLVGETRYRLIYRQEVGELVALGGGYWLRVIGINEREVRLQLFYPVGEVRAW